MNKSNDLFIDKKYKLLITNMFLCNHKFLLTMKRRIITFLAIVFSKSLSSDIIITP